MKNWSPNLKRDLAFLGIAVFVVFGIWGPAWEAPVWVMLVSYLLAVACLVPGVKNGREVGFDSIGNAIIPVASVVLMMIGAIGYFVWEMFLRY